MTDERSKMREIEAALDGLPLAAFKARLRRALEERIMTTMTHALSETNVDPPAGARPGFTAVTPYVIVQEVDRAIDFAIRVFGAQETHRSTGSAGGTHCELRIGDSMLMLGGGAALVAGQPHVPDRPAALHVYVDDADAIYARAIAAGARSLGIPRNLHYGERAGFVKDPAGNEWYIATHTGPSYSEEGLRSVTPSLRAPHAMALVDFLKAGLDARVEVMYSTPEGSVQHGVVRIGGAAVEISEGSPEWGHIRPAFYLYVPDCDALYERAVNAGATSLYAPSNQPYGDRMGGVDDAWGNRWFIATHLGAP